MLSYQDSADDLRLGDCGMATDDLSGAILVNITGLQPEQAIAALEGRLRHRCCRK